MEIMTSGLDPETGELLVEPLAERDFVGALLGALPDRGAELIESGTTHDRGRSVRGRIERLPTPDLGNPRVAGWTYLVAHDDPQRGEIARILRPLADHRGMTDPDQPLLFRGEPSDGWADWITSHYQSVKAKPPYYVVIVGGPDRVPFHFQAALDSVACVGRLAFDNLVELEAYVDKVLRIEAAADSVVRREALMFATDRGKRDPTYYSRRHMAEPLVGHMQERGVPVTQLTGPDATAGRLLEALATAGPALVYIACHGVGRRKEALEEQRRTNGALVCADNGLLRAADIPDTPVAEGAVVFGFACFSAGTPAASDYAHWLGRDRFNAESDFVAALPKRLLAHPRGPVAFVGHVDAAWLHAFDDPDVPDLETPWHPRLAPFSRALETILDQQPVALAMRAMRDRFNTYNIHLVDFFEKQRRGISLSDTPEQNRKLVNAFITRSDAQNYMVLGDPAVYPNMSTD